MNPLKAKVLSFDCFRHAFACCDDGAENCPYYRGKPRMGIELDVDADELKRMKERYDVVLIRGMQCAP